MDVCKEIIDNFSGQNFFLLFFGLDILRLGRRAKRDGGSDLPLQSSQWGWGFWWLGDRPGMLWNWTQLNSTELNPNEFCSTQQKSTKLNLNLLSPALFGSFYFFFITQLSQIILSNAILRPDRQLCSLPKENSLWTRWRSWDHHFHFFPLFHWVWSGWNYHLGSSMTLVFVSTVTSWTVIGETNKLSKKRLEKKLLWIVRFDPHRRTPCPWWHSITNSSFDDLDFLERVKEQILYKGKGSKRRNRKNTKKTVLSGGLSVNPTQMYETKLA